MDSVLESKRFFKRIDDAARVEREKNYPSPFWNELEAKRRLIYEDKTTLKDAIKIIMEITDTILKAAKKRFMPDKYEQIDKNDIYYCEKIWDEISMIWDSENVDEQYQEVFGVVRKFSGEKFTLKSLIEEFNKIKDKYI